MRLRWTIAVAAVFFAGHERWAVANPNGQACVSESTDEDVSSHMSLLQASVQITKLEPPPQQQREPNSRTQPAKAHTFASLATLASEHGSREAAQAHAAFFLANAFLVVAIICLFFYLRLRGDGARWAETDDNDADVEVRFPLKFEEDVYMMAIALVVRDWYSLSKGSRYPSLPAIRIGYSTTLLFVTLTMQMALLWCTKAYVTPQQVASIRDSYDQYEVHMHGGENNTRVLYTGKHRGLPQFFQPELFETLDDSLKGDVCQIPFSQLKFLVFVLLIWTITCVSQLKTCFIYIWNLLVMLPTVSSMADACVCESVDKPRRRCTIVGLTLQGKLLICFLIFMPWMLSTCYLCWLGCRWLAATNSFGDFIGNAMALEFILCFKTLMYCAVCGERTKRDLQTTKILPPSKTEDASFFSYFNTLVWGAAAMCWVYAYIFHFQHVLPDYQWDVHGPCTPYLMGQLRPDAD